MATGAQSTPKRPVTQLAKLDLNLLVILRELIHERNVTRAAERVAISQPAASAALGRLRRHFDDELLIRRSGGYVLSPLASQLVEHVEQACAAAERVFTAEAQFDPRTSEREFTLLLGDYTMAVLADRLSAFTAEHGPHLRLDVRLVRETMAQEIEAIRHVDGIISPPASSLLAAHVRSIELFRDRWVCICARGNGALAATERPGLAQLAELDWVVPHLPEPGRPSSAPLVIQLAMLGIQPPVTVRVAGSRAVPLFVAGTDRVALVQERLARRVAGELDLRVIECPEADEPIVEALWWSEDYDGDPAHRWLRQSLQTLAAEL